MSYSVSQVAKALSVSPSSVRLWSSKFSEHLSASATPASGGVREYTEEDIAVLQTITVMRRGDESYKKINIALEKGERREFVPEPEPEREPEAAHNAPGEAESDIALKSFTETLNALQVQNTANSEHIKELQGQLIEATGKAAVSEHLSAELERAREEAERLREELAIARLPWWRKLGK